MKQALAAAAWLVAGLAGVADAGEGGKADLSPKAFSTEEVRFFEEKVRPILSARCIKCHGGTGKVRGGLRLDDRAAVLKGGDLGPAVSLDQPEESILLQAIRYEELEMPPGGKLPQGELDILTRWVKDGVPWTSRPAPTLASTPATPSAPAASRAIAAARREWSYQPVVRPAVPLVKGRDAIRNPIDAFILARLEVEGLRPAPEADRATLIRRLTYDLTGLPPTPEEVDAFLADDSRDAYERLVDRLLASPRYGEHWGRHWLDLVRFAETNGYERDSAKPFAWRYRDYVVDAYNRDKPYDQFVREQLAGDEINPDSAESLIATGFYRLGIWDDEPADRPQARYDTLDGIISTTGQVVLGMTVNCARCHDHKVDPIPQRDYYRLLAFFIDVTHPDGKNLRKVENTSGSRIEVMSVTERGQDEAHVLLRGSPALVGPPVEPGVPEVLDAGTGSFTKGRGKRRALAEWLTDPRNPRTARILANRLWQYHFGRGIVPTPNDYGKLGEPATHPELLDWLAAELVANGWQIKPMHRLIVLSAAYRMSSRATPAELAADPSNRWFWRFPMRRLAAEEVRDAMLAVSGVLRHKAGGPSVYPPIPREVMAGQSVPGSGWKTSKPDEAARRSIYVHVKRSLLVPILAVHDAADTDSSCPVRYTTTVPTQALGMLNGAFANEQAGHLADRLRCEAPGDVAAQVRRALRLTAARDADEGEVRDDVEFIRTLLDRSRLDERAALSQYCLMILNANAFLYLD
jgi:Protein of unknown function (DUF1549)/Protein of unknown function (DUF1553)/Planctomycete cytochrome C